MNYKEYAFTASEITQLEYILSIMPASREIQRIGLEHRLRKAKERLNGVPIPPKPKIIHVNFRGEAVIDGVGMDTNFAGKVTMGFAGSTAITTAGATGRLDDTGGIPNSGLGLQILTGVTRESFGFEIELPPPTEDERRLGQTANPAERAVEMIQDLLETSLEGSDDDLVELTSRMHPRVVRKVAEFLGIIKKNGAQVEIGLNDRKVALRSPDEVQKAATRLTKQNIRGETITLAGTLISMVPARGLFEFMTPGGGENMEGKIGHEIRDPYRVTARYANREVRARIRRTQVGESQPKYTLLEILGPADDPTSL